MPNYPASAYTPATKTAGQTITAAFFNDPDSEINAIELALISTGLAHNLRFVDATYDIGDSAIAFRPRDFFLSRNATVGGTLAVTGVTTLTADLAFSANAVISRNTSDGSDNGRLVFTAGGADGQTRASSIRSAGNEDVSIAGYLDLFVGNVAGSLIRHINAAGIAMFQQEGSNGSATFTSSIAGIQAQFNQSNATPVGLDVNYTGAAPNGTGNFFFRGRDTGATRFELRSNGGLANFSANDVNLSDASIKDIFGPATSQRDLFRRLEFVEARYKDAPTTPLDVMLTAQQVQTVYPDLVTEFADGKLGVREHGIVMRGLKVVQELDGDMREYARRLALVEKALIKTRKRVH